MNRQWADNKRLRARLVGDVSLLYEALRAMDRNSFRRAKERGNQAQRLNLIRVWRRDKGHCYLCRVKLKIWEFTLDHVVPLSKGGAHNYSNVRVCCLPCNLKKGSSVPA